MQSFNLTFRGEIKPGYGAEGVRRRFADLLGLDDDRELARCFSGEAVTLREGLDRRAAAELYRQLDRLGVTVQVVASGLAADETAPPPAPDAGTPPRPGKRRRAAVRRSPPGEREEPGNGAPNLYALTPFRASAALRQRPVESRRLMFRYLALAAVTFAALLLAAGLRLTQARPPPLAGPGAIATLHGGGLALAVPGRLLLHDRAGVGSESLPLEALGLASVSALQPLPEGGGYLVSGRARSPGNDEASGDAAAGGNTLWHCQLEEPRCRPFGAPRAEPSRAVAMHPFSGIAIEALGAGTLRKLDSEGTELARVARDLAPEPALMLRDGLLYANSTEAPALSVLRYEDRALGRQLDEILLLAPPALAAGRERVADFALLDGRWWAILHNPDNGDRGLYLFDGDWGFLREVPLPAGFAPRDLLVWGRKMLVLDPARPALQRFNSEARAEVPLHSDLLAGLIEDRERREQLRGTLWYWLLAALLLATAGCAALYRWHHLRQLAFKPGRLRGAEPVEHRTESIRWLDYAPGREGLLRKLSHLFLGAGGLLLLGAAALRVEAQYLAALLCLLAGLAAALLRYRRARPGHVGVLGRQLLLVDHRGTYHLGSGAQILFRGWFLMIDDVLVHTGPAWAPVFVTGQLHEHIVPLARLGVGVDRRAVLARLVETRHPLAQCAALALAGAIAALVLVLLPGS